MKGSEWLSTDGMLMYWHISGDCKIIAEMVYGSDMDGNNVLIYKLLSSGPFLPIPLENYLVAFNWTKIVDGAYIKSPQFGRYYNEQKITLTKYRPGKYKVYIGEGKLYSLIISYVHELQWIFKLYNKDQSPVIRSEFLEKGSQEIVDLAFRSQILIEPDGFKII